MSRLIIAHWIVLCMLCAGTRANVTTTFDYDQWQSLVGDFSTINFTGYPDGTSVTNQYSQLGVTFIGASFIAATTGFVNDGWGLHGPSGLHLGS